MKPFFENRNRLIRAECKALKREMKQQIKLFDPPKTAREIDEEISEKVVKKYPDLEANTIYCIWTNKNYGKRRKNKKEAA